MESPIIDGDYIMKRMDTKGGWHFVLLPSIAKKSGLPFGWNIVKGSIDDYNLTQYKLWPTADGQLFLPIKNAIRKKIKKKEGDLLRIVLFEDHSPVMVPEEMEMCLLDCPLAKFHFEALSDTSKKQYVDYIFGVKNLESRARRMTKAIEKLERGLKFHERRDDL